MHCEQAKRLYYGNMIEEIESILADEKNYYNYAGIPILVENWERERCSMFLVKMSSKRNNFPKECMYYSAFRNAIFNRQKKFV